MVIKMLLKEWLVLAQCRVSYRPTRVSTWVPQSDTNCGRHLWQVAAHWGVVPNLLVILWWTLGISYRSNRLSTDDGQSDEKAKASLQLRNKLLMFDGKAHNYFLNNARRIWRQISQNVFVPDDRGFDHSLIVWECEVIDLPVAFLTFRAKHKVSAYQRPTCEDLSSAGLIAHTHVLQLTRKNKTKQGCERTCRAE